MLGARCRVGAQIMAVSGWILSVLLAGAVAVTESASAPAEIHKASQHLTSSTHIMHSSVTLFTGQDAGTGYDHTVPGAWAHMGACSAIH